MEPKGATDIAIRNRNYNIKPAQVVDAHTSDEDNDFPEFEFPVSNGVSTLDAWKAVSTGGGQPTQALNGNSTWGFLQPGGLFSDESPKKMPLAFRSKSADAVPERSPFFPSLISEPPVTNSKPQVLSPLVTFKNLDVSFDYGKVDDIEEKSPAVPSILKVKSSVISSKVTSDSAATAVASTPTTPSPPTRKSLSAASRASSDSAAPLSTPATKSLSKLQADLARTPERAKSGALSASAVSGKALGGGRSFALTTPRGRDEATRPLSPTPDRRSLTSPRRLAPERSRSPVPFQTPDRLISGVSRSLSPSPRSITPTRAALRAPLTPRSTSPVPTRFQGSNPPKEQWNGNTTRSASTPNSPRYITPTRAASLKAVKTPATPNGTVAKELQYSPPNAGNTTPRSDPVKKAPKEAHAKISDDGHPTLKVRTSPPLTQPSGFHFKTDERSEKRRDFYQKLEERMKAKEEERKKLEAKAQEEKEAQLKELRKSLGYKANPVPKFYQEPPPPPVEIKKSPPTRARSPNFTAPRRRDSCMGSFSESTSSSGSSPLRSRLVRSPSLESNSGSHSSHVSHSHSAARVSAAPKVKQPFKPI